jgi:hypothetical protein
MRALRIFIILTAASAMALTLVPATANAATAQLPPRISLEKALSLQKATGAADLHVALCDYDGPCLNLTENSDGSAVTMFSYSSTDEYESLVYGFPNAYGCNTVTATCPFVATDFDADFKGDYVVTLDWSSFGNCADSYPGINMVFDPCTLDRSVFVVDGNTLISPYWTNHYGQAWVLYGPPLGDQAYVEGDYGGPREEWSFRDLS